MSTLKILVDLTIISTMLGYVNAFNKLALDKDKSGLVESCDACNRLIFNWDSIGDRAFLSFNGINIFCLVCWNEERLKILKNYEYSPR